ncbi:MAG: hypothetical protein J5851_02560 [Oscillospiraceae bacterium]|nr:hypothetical protein [Oscillospiraceae bacterium]
MHRTRNQNRGSFQLHGETIPELLHAVKMVLSDRQYHELCAAVNETAGYVNKRGLIFAAVQSRIKREEGCLE